MFTLCDLDTTSILSCKDLKQAIRRQLSDDIIDNFDVRYMEGSSVVRIRNGCDLEEVWSCIRNPGSKCKMILWCDGLSKNKESRKRPRIDEIPERNTKTNSLIGNRRFSNWLIV